MNVYKEGCKKMNGEYIFYKQNLITNFQLLKVKVVRQFCLSSMRNTKRIRLNSDTDYLSEQKKSKIIGDETFI